MTRMTPVTLTRTLREMSRPLQSDGRLHGVIAGIRDGDHRLLMIRRAQNIWAAGKVCFPGGSMEVGETQEAALVREMQEELGIDVKPLCQVWRWESMDPEDPNARPGFVYPLPLTLWGWEAQIISGDPTPHPDEIAEFRWMSEAEIAAHPDCLPTNCLFLEALNRRR